MLFILIFVLDLKVTETEDVHVIKLVDLVARIPKHLDLHFYDFSTNL